MLQFILGSSKTGKTTLVHNMIKELTKDNQNPVMLLVPEQFTYETEKGLFKFLGASSFMNVKVTSFSRLASEIFKLYGGCASEYASDSAKSILMDIAVNEMSDNLNIYQKSSKSKTFSDTMLQTVTEFKNAGVYPDELYNASQKLDGYLGEKTAEIAQLYATYNSLLYSTYQDPLDDISRAVKKLYNTDFFKGYTIFFDEFKGFTANENDLLKLIFSSAKNTYVSLCMDIKRANESDISVFTSVKNTYNKLKRFCTQSGVHVKPSIILDESSDSGYKITTPQELVHIEKNLFSNIVRYYKGSRNSLTAMLCKNEYDEVDYVLSSISELVQSNGYKYDDIVIITRDLDTYMSKLETGFSKYNIPYYCDTTIKITSKPLIRFISNSLTCITNGFKSENILAILKCGLSPFSIEEISKLENYIYIWGIESKQWFNPFTSNPQGFKEGFSDSETDTLKQLNQIRSFVADNLKELEKIIKKSTGRDICKAIIKFLENFGVKSAVEATIKLHLETENFTLSQEYSRVWEIVMELLNTLAVTLDKAIVGTKRFLKLYNLICSSYDMGTLPQSLDCVIVGSAERIRTAEKKATFILGVNENIFPFVPSVSGMFTDNEREQLIAAEIEISPPIKDRILEERFIAYKAICTASEKLFLTARKSDISGKPLSPSIVFSQIKKMFGQQIIDDTDFIDKSFYCKTKTSAFSYFAKSFMENTSLTSTLKYVLNHDMLYQPKLVQLERTAQKLPFEISNKENAKLLFGDKLNISPTRVEGFYQCRFKYFCEHGLRAYPRKKAALDPLETGTLIHSIVYSITKQTDLKNDYDEKAIKKQIKVELDLYIEQVMGGVKDKTKRFIYLYNRMRLSIFKIIEQIYNELKQSRFEPCDYEFEISNNNEITPLVLTSEDNTQITVAGKIDRIDVYKNNNGDKYIRIIDYKSGKKVFSLNDILYGLNLQMLIYLFCITSNGNGRYQNSLPAGILYMPAGEQPPSLPRDASQNDINKLMQSHYKMNGLMLMDNDVLNAMEENIKGTFIPVSTKLDGNFTSQSLNSLVTLKELGKINSYINKLITSMAQELHIGRIEAVPIENTCSYCNYSSVCRIDPASPVKEYIKYDKAQILSTLTAETKEATENKQLKLF